MISLSDLKKYLEPRLRQELPGSKAHQEVAPYRNVDFTKEIILKATLSSVLILFYEKDHAIYTTLIQRSTYNGNHSGQISFPGGKMEKTDASLMITALRETQEEIGLSPDEITIIGQLSDVFITVSNFCVTPIIGCVSFVPSFVPDKREVKKIIELKVTDLLLNENLQSRTIQLSDNNKIKAPCFVFDETIVWGATALILNELRYLLNEFEASND